MEFKRKQKCKRVISATIALLLFCIILVWGQVYGKTGGLYLVGLGPGDPDLATVKAVRLLQEADII